MDMQVKRVLVVMAHPDDAEIGCGGTVAKWVKEGKEIRYLICTSGDKGTKDSTVSPHSMAEIREEEQRQAAQILGVRRITFLRHKDGELKDTPGFRDEIAVIIRDSKPDIVVTHDPWRLYQLHPDHRECGFAVCDAVVAARDHLFLPALQDIGLDAHTPQEIYLTFPEKPDIWVDITGFLDTKLSALSRHKSQTDRVPDWKARISKINSDMAEEESFEFAEAFKIITLTRREL
jgi:LmbE family N-acetylglucosaminyl deacetylase